MQTDTKLIAGALAALIVVILMVLALVHEHSQTTRTAIQNGYIQVQDHGEGFHWEKPHHE